MAGRGGEEEAGLRRSYAGAKSPGRELTLESPPTPLRREGRKGLVPGLKVSVFVKCTAGNSRV